MIKLPKLDLFSNAHDFRDLKAVVRYQETHGQAARIVLRFAEVFAMSVNMHSPAGRHANEAHHEIVKLSRSCGVSADVPPLARNAEASARQRSDQIQPAHSLVFSGARGPSRVFFVMMHASLMSIALQEYSQQHRAGWDLVTKDLMTASVNGRSEA